MSVVLAVCGNNYIKMISDGRVVRFDENKPPVVVNENYNKLRRINESVILGFAGDKVICEDIIRKLKKVLIGFTQKTGIDEIANLIQILLKDTKLGFLKVHFIVGGKTSNGQFGMCILNSATNFTLEKYSPNYGEHQIKVSMPFSTQEACDCLVQENLNLQAVKNLHTLDRVMENFVSIVADLDCTVNKNYFKIQILGNK